MTLSFDAYALKPDPVREILLDELLEDSADQLALVGDPILGLPYHDAAPMCIEYNPGLLEGRISLHNEVVEVLVRTRVGHPRPLFVPLSYQDVILQYDNSWLDRH
jgi:hypothetical protein